MVADGKANVYYYVYSSKLGKWQLEKNMLRIKDAWWASWSSPYGWPVRISHYIPLFNFISCDLI